MRDWDDLPANAQTVADVESCIDCLQKHGPYPPNARIDRESFAAARMGYTAAIFELEKFMCKLTDEIKMAEMDDEEFVENSDEPDVVLPIDG